MIHRPILRPADHRFIRGPLLLRHGIPRLIPRQGPIRIFERVGHVHVQARVPQPDIRLGARRFDRNRRGPVRVHPMHRATHHVRAPIADLPAAGLHDPTERAVAIPLVIRAPTHRAQPQVPIEFRGRIAVGHRLLVDLAGIVKTSDPVDVPNRAIRKVTMRKIGLRLRTPLRTHLNRHLVVMRGTHHRRAFLDRAARRFLHVHMFAGLARMDHLHGVPMIGSRNHHRIDVLALDDIPVVAIRHDARSKLLQRIAQPIFIHIAHRRHVHVAGVDKPFHVVHVVAGHSARADKRDRQPFVRARRAFRAKHTRRKNHRQPHSRPRNRHKRTS